MSANIHDQTFKQLMSHTTFFIGFCETYLPASIKEQIDFATAKLFHLYGEHTHRSIQKGKVAKTDIADILYQVQTKKTGEEKLIFIHTEHFFHPPKHAVENLKIISHSNAWYKVTTESACL